MANLEEGVITLQLDRPRRWVCDCNALAEFEGVTGKSVLAALGRRPGESAQAFSERVGFREIRALLWAGLLAADENVSLKEAGRLIGHAPGKNFGEKIQALMLEMVKGLNMWGEPSDDDKKKVTRELNEFLAENDSIGGRFNESPMGTSRG